MLAQLDAQVAEQQRFAANASHELRTPLTITQTLLEVARNDRERDSDELVDRLYAVNARAIEVTEALLLLSRADQRSFISERVDLSLVAEEATETLLIFAEARGTTIETSGENALCIGSHALLLQMTTNLVHNAIVHNLPRHGTVWMNTSTRADTVVLTVENTGEHSPHSSSPRWSSRSSAAPNAYAVITLGSVSDWRSSTASPRLTMEPSRSPPGLLEGSASACNYPLRYRREQAEDLPNLRAS